MLLVGEWLKVQSLKCPTLSFESWRFELELSLVEYWMIHGWTERVSMGIVTRLIDYPTISSRTNWHSLVSNCCKMRPPLTLLRIKKGLQISIYMGCSDNMWKPLNIVSHCAFIITLHSFPWCRCLEDKLITSLAFVSELHGLDHSIGVNKMFCFIPYVFESREWFDSIIFNSHVKQTTRNWFSTATWKNKSIMLSTFLEIHGIGKSTAGVRCSYVCGN